eukprot:TRINITY_DN4391_c0_g1_i5.p1 TRINITY_DN4391_c0_g1~~TRINITY_DN4391_c0_g1_i5.p1  ORF type:complete len:187 (-),score=10.40 TRINITY_DN4391_c0_g1_i5:433-993(-)
MGKSLHMKDWIAKGVYTINDILNERREPVSLHQLETKVGKAPQRILEYNAVMTAFNQTQRQNRLHLVLEYNAAMTDLNQTQRKNRLHLVEHNELNPTKLLVNGRPITTMKCKDFRTILIENTQPCATNFWKRKLNIEMTDKHWNLVFNCTRETRLRVLQWKILHNIYPTNILLNKMGLSNSSQCNV